MASTIITKYSGTASAVPVSGDLTQGELAVNTADKRLFTKNGGGTVVELGTNPASLALPNGTANGVAYLNGSKVVTTGSALTFDGTNLGVGGAGSYLLDVKATTDASHFQVTSSANANNTAFRIGTDGTGVFFNATGGSTGNMQFRVYGSEQMRLTSTGLGIGTSSPTQKLDVAGQVTISSGNGYLWGNGAVQIYSNLSYLRFRTASTDRLEIDSSGNLGLGVTPSAWSAGKAFQFGTTAASLWNDGGYEVRLSSNAYYNAGWKYLNSNGATSYVVDNTQHRWYIAPSGTAGNAITFTQAMTLDASGNLLVGTTSSSAYVNANSTLIGIPSGYTAGVYINHASGIGGGNLFMGFGYNAGQIGSITQNGTTAVSYNTSSDYRLKHDIAPMTGALAKVAALNPVTYKWNADDSDGEGFIAHELAEVCPHAVTGEKDAVDEDGNPVYQGIDTGFLVATLTAAIKEQQALITQLTDRITALEGK